MKKIILIFIASILITSPALAQNRKKEIMAHVIEPCLKAGSLKKKLSKDMSAKSVKEAIQIIKILNEAHIKKVVSDTSKLVKGKDQKTRKKLYRFLKKICLESLKEDLKKAGKK